MRERNVHGLTTIAATRTVPRVRSTARSPITMRRSASIRTIPIRTTSAAGHAHSLATICRVLWLIANDSLRLRPNDGNTLNSRGLVQFKLGAFKESIADYDAALEQTANDAESLFARGVAKVKLGDSAGGNADIAAAKAIKADVADVARIEVQAKELVIQLTHEPNATPNRKKTAAPYPASRPLAKNLIDAAP